MLNHHLNYPTFDTLESQPELELYPRAYKKLNPLTSGQFIAGLNTQKNQGKYHPYFDENLFDASGLSFRYVKKPLVLYFYSKEWGQAATDQLKQLHAIQQQLVDYNSNILVIHDGAAEDLKRIFWEESISLETYQDAEHEIAQLLGIYSEASPAWNTYAGIDTNIPLPSVYVLDHERRIIFDFQNEGIESGLPSTQLINAVEQYVYYSSHKKSA